MLVLLLPNNIWAGAQWDQLQHCEGKADETRWWKKQVILHSMNKTIMILHSMNLTILLHSINLTILLHSINITIMILLSMNITILLCHRFAQIWKGSIIILALLTSLDKLTPTKSGNVQLYVILALLTSLNTNVNQNYCETSKFWNL